MQIGAAGSPGVKPLRSVGPLEGIQNRVGAGVQVRYVTGDQWKPVSRRHRESAQSGEAGFRAEYSRQKS